MPGVMRNNKYSRLATSDCSPSHKTNPNYTNSTHELLQQQIHQQEHLVQHQDAQLSQMSQSVGTLRNMSTAIGSELDEQAVMLDEFGAEIEQAETKLDATMRKMVRIEFRFLHFRRKCLRRGHVSIRALEKNFLLDFEIKRLSNPFQRKHAQKMSGKKNFPNEVK